MARPLRQVRIHEADRGLRTEAPIRNVLRRVARFGRSHRAVANLPPFESTMTSLLLSLLLRSQLQSQAAVANPFMKGADPHAAVVGKTVWVYPTDGTHRIGAAFWAYSSDDLRTWKEHGPVLKFDDIPWIKEDKA